MITVLFLAALLAQSGAPHFSEDPDAVSTPGATQALQPAPLAKPTTVNVVASRGQQILAEENKEDPVSCQAFETTGTRFTTKKCLRKSQWEELSRRGKEDYEAFSAGGAIVPGH